MLKTGKIKWFDFGKGYGFIVPNEGGPDAMLHITQCHECEYSPRQYDCVVFEAKQTQGGMRTTWIRRVERAYP